MADSRPILVTGFEPFGGATRNPSADVARALAGELPGVVCDVLPVVFDAAAERIDRLIAEHRPAAWVGLGLHEGASAITIERRAVNRDDARLPDNAGDQRQDRAIDPGGPDGYPATLPVERMAAAVADLGLPWVYSDSAGRFVCNHTFYRAAAAVRRRKLTTRVGFLHLPWPAADWGPTPRGEPGLPLAGTTAAVRACIVAVRRDCHCGWAKTRMAEAAAPRPASVDLSRGV